MHHTARGGTGSEKKLDFSNVNVKLRASASSITAVSDCVLSAHCTNRHSPSRGNKTSGRGHCWIQHGDTRDGHCGQEVSVGREEMGISGMETGRAHNPQLKHKYSAIC